MKSTAMLYIFLIFIASQMLFEVNVVFGNVPPDFDHGVSLPTNRPLVIAHQGASGVLPSHTRESYNGAVIQGTDVIECDVCITRDLQLVCLHESWLNGSTNVAALFPPSRANTYYIIDDDIFITDYFSVDFTLEELKTIGKRQTNDQRDPNFNYLYEVATLEECIQIAKSANRPIGIYPETKQTLWTNSLDIVRNSNTTFEDILLEVLVRHGYTLPTDPCFIQSFDLNNLLYLRNRTQLPLIQLMNPDDDISDEKLEEYSSYCYGIGPAKSMIVKPDPVTGNILEVTDLVARAHSFGMRVHAWTFRNENRDLLWDYKQDPHLEYQQFLDTGLDGFFTDFPETMVRFLNATYV